jgi:hypothetical protein
MLIRLSACAWALLCATAAHAEGSPLPVPTVEYSADRVMETSAGTFNGRVYAARGRERAELEIEGMKSAMILKFDEKVGYMLMPAQKMYQTVDFAKARQQAGTGPTENVSISVVGREDVEGRSATKYKVLMKDGSAGGFMWFTDEGIAVKMDLLVKSGGGKSDRMTVTLKNLQIGPQDPAVFEVPSGYTKMPSFGAGAFGGAAMPGAATSAAGGVLGGAKKLLGLGR